MATNSISKSLYAAPLGIEEGVGMDPIEIEIEDPESVRIGMGDIEIELSPDKGGTDEEFNANLADFMDDSVLGTLGNELIDDMTYMLTEGGERNICALREKARKLLEKEKEQIMDAYDEGWSDAFADKDLNAEYYNETFNTNQENLQDSTNGYTYYPQENKTVFNTKEK